MTTFVDAGLLVAAAVCAGFRLAGAEIPLTLQNVPLLASFVVLGLPHGAVDHLVPGFLAARRPGAGAVLAVVAAYAVLGSATLVIWAAAPAAVLVFFLVVTWFHWGQGDLAANATSLPARVAPRLLHLVVRGAIPVAIPFLVDPTAVVPVLDSMLRPWGLTATRWLDGFGTGERLAAAVVLGALILCERAAAWRGRRPGWWRATAETLVLVALFAAAPPVLAIGLYFCLWHSLRHILRLMAIDPVIATLLAHGRLLRACGRFAARAAPLTVAALLLLAVVDVALPHARTAAGLSGIYLVLVSALTVPHLSIVATMDVVQRVWPLGSPPRFARCT